ncbi:hypothetical protein CB1_064113048 [Camelus ferus]|nr:hypothetical protein CB1_064113048 [Camelus ferus]
MTENETESACLQIQAALTAEPRPRCPEAPADSHGAAFGAGGHPGSCRGSERQQGCADLAGATPGQLQLFLACCSRLLGQTAVKAGGMRIVQKHPHSGDTKEEKDQDDQEWESPRSRYAPSSMNPGLSREHLVPILPTHLRTATPHVWKFLSAHREAPRCLLDVTSP